MDYKPPFRFVCEPDNDHLLDADGTRIDLEDACALLNSSLTDGVPESIVERVHEELRHAYGAFGSTNWPTKKMLRAALQAASKVK